MYFSHLRVDMLATHRLVKTKVSTECSETDQTRAAERVLGTDGYGRAISESSHLTQP